MVALASKTLALDDHWLNSKIFLYLIWDAAHSDALDNKSVFLQFLLSRTIFFSQRWMGMTNGNLKTRHCYRYAQNTDSQTCSQIRQNLHIYKVGCQLLCFQWGKHNIKF